ncbi:tape measure protein [Castellaniella ginsengisoli]|uniref:Tape measure protein n=1 Tax=Castellaniella ginsengisoli TaxID=546114 RepID=A0AB39G2J0_9BURK
MAIVRELVTLLRYQVDRAGLTEYAKKARTVGQQVSGVGRAAMQGWREGVNQALASYGLVPGKVWQGIREQRRLNAEQRKSARNVKEIGGGYTALAGYIRGALAYVGVTATAGLADEWAGVEARIGLATDSIEDQQRALKSLYASAQASGQDYLATGDLFTSVSRNRKELGLGLDQSLQLTDTIGKLLTIGGGSAGSQQAALTQLGQALGSGVLRGDELNSILEQAPRLAQAVADSFGVSVGQLRKLGQEGKLTSKELADGLLKLGKDIDAEFERMPKTFGRGATLIRNAWGRMIWQLNRASAASESFYAVSKLIAENMVAIVKVGAMALLAAGVMRLLPLLKKMRGGAKAVLWPFLRMYAILEAIRLIGDDVLTWLRGGRSVLGGIIGRSEEWKTQVDWVKGVLEGVKNLIGDASLSVGEFAKKWGTVGLVVAGIVMLIGWIPTAIAAVALIIIRYWGDIQKAGEDIWKAFTDGAAQSWVEVKASFQRLLNWFVEKKDSLVGFFDGLVPDVFKGDNPGPSAATVQRSGSASISAQDNRQTNITIQGVAGNPAAVGRAAEEGVRRGYGSAVPVVPPGYLSPNVEAMP